MAIRTNSNKVEKGDTFVALRGEVTDGHLYIRQAIEAGASRIVCMEGNYDEVETVVVPDTYTYLRQLLKEEYYDAIQDLRLIGVTGTNGKTTITYLLYQALNQLGIKTSYIGTIGFYLDDQVEQLERTTPQIEEVYEMLYRSKQKGVTTVVMEVSSHALKLNRLDYLNFDFAIFTNLTEDHLDFHKTFDDYLHAKQKLFYKMKENGLAILNADDPYCSSMINQENENILYGYHKSSSYRVKKRQLDLYGTKFQVSHDGINFMIETSLLGEFNISNLLSVVIVLDKMGFSMEEIQKTVKELTPPPGRMDLVPYRNNVIVVDYAHTPDAVFQLLFLAKQLTNHKIYSIIGCGGNRDREKRRIMAKYATTLSDFVIMTSDNPRNEDPELILKDMSKALYKDNFMKVIDRKEAIQKGISLLTCGDLLLILGKGHESYQIIGSETFYHNDKDFVLQYIDRLN